MRLVFAGTPEVAVPSLDALLGSGHDVVAVVTRPDAPSGRGRKLTPSPVAERAAAAGIEILTPRRPSEDDFVARLTELAPDCCPVVAYGGLIPPTVLAIPPRGWVNLHFSLLPAWRGAAPVQRAVLAGDDVTGASTFLLEAGLDTGPVFGVLTEPIRPDDTSGALLERLSVAGARLLLDTVDGIAAGTLEPRTQPADGISHAAKLNPEDVRVDWSAPAHLVDRLIRAGTPAPGPWTTFRDKRVKLGPVRPADQALTERLADQPAPGVLVQVDKATVAVGTGSVPVILGDVRAEGKQPMPAADWARGLRLVPGDHFA